jgi:hypothetical protein
MLIYRTKTRVIRPREQISRITAAGDATDILMAAGELEAGVVDALCPAADSWHPTLAALREASMAAGRFFLGRSPMPAVIAAFDALATLELPPHVEVSVPEGYAYYGLYPETYARAAGRFHEEMRPERVGVIGIRSIGTSLGAVVAAALEARGCEVHSWTVRPRGHPFYRTLSLSPELERQFRAHASWHFAIVDEGPGLSGSSLACVAEKLSWLGVPDERVVFFPSWDPDPGNFVSKTAGARWRRHRKYTAVFEPGGGLRDFSAGKWRRSVYPAGSIWPAVQPQHERRKYLDGGTLLKFAGLGRFGRAKLPRAFELAEAGFSPRALGFENGFLRLSFVEGRPLSARDRSPALIAAMARYLAHLWRRQASGDGARFEDLAGMIEVNTGLDAGRLERFRAMVTSTRSVAIDGRMLPHEWLLTSAGFLKTDSLDHTDDHFLPGCTDIAWDLAGASIEFGLSPQEAAHFVETYTALSGDREAGRRLPFFRLAYLAFRLGYATVAQNTLRGSPDALRFAALAARYRARLRAAVRNADL